MDSRKAKNLAIMTSHHSTDSEIAPGPTQTDVMMAGDPLHQNKVLKSRAGGEGDCDFGRFEATPLQVCQIPSQTLHL